MEMYAITFFTLIENSLKLDGENYRILANIYSLPHLKPAQAKEIINILSNYGERSKGVTTKQIASDRERLKRLLATNSPV